MIDLARRSGQIVSINAYVVNDKDDFEYELGLHIQTSSTAPRLLLIVAP